MGEEKRDFDREAASWDQDPGRLRLARDVAGAIREEARLSLDMDVMDFGCGTGLLSLHLQPFVRSVTGVDGSQGMLDVFGAKVRKLCLSNVRLRRLDLEGGDALEGSYDLIVSSMTMHHIRDVRPLLGRLYRVTSPGGCLCIADLDPDDGQFHGGHNDGVFHAGFDRQWMRDAFLAAGFVDARDRTAATVVKPGADGIKRAFTVGLVTGRKEP